MKESLVRQISKLKTGKKQEKFQGALCLSPWGLLKKEKRKENEGAKLANKWISGQPV